MELVGLVIVLGLIQGFISFKVSKNLLWSILMGLFSTLYFATIPLIVLFLVVSVFITGGL